MRWEFHCIIFYRTDEEMLILYETVNYFWNVENSTCLSAISETHRIIKDLDLFLERRNLFHLLTVTKLMGFFCYELKTSSIWADHTRRNMVVPFKSSQVQKTKKSTSFLCGEWEHVGVISTLIIYWEVILILENSINSANLKKVRLYFGKCK